ncbi:PLAT domain-containing protein 2-like [Panicum virgatum]|uniref:PLAT domain-containing protein n=1 Tax=Panicum virgatum TaxID=38727 RepID=A0A8T0PYB7_PANVG|nr:PLAT domain-containing protein 2-like [Panicum virgatum]KAG2566085.1 hypothetical protein PVAP13_7NG173800 [Panicum virgatum]
MGKIFVILLISLVFSARSSIASDDDDECYYVVKIQTGWQKKAGTDSRITFTMGDGGREITTNDLAKYCGTGGRFHNYFERGSLDEFRCPSLCLRHEPCLLYLESDMRGLGAGWYVEYVEAYMYPNRAATEYTYYHKFVVKDWLDSYPYNRWVLVNDTCTAWLDSYNSSYNNRGTLINDTPVLPADNAAIM